jgi:hypothetical protein
MLNFESGFLQAQDPFQVDFLLYTQSNPRLAVSQGVLREAIVD